MKTSIKLAIVLLIFGIVIPLATLRDLKVLIKGEHVNINECSAPDLEDFVMAEGKIDFVYGPFATYEETEKKFGVTVSKRETNYYIIGNFTDEMLFSDDEGEFFYCIFSTANKDTMAKLDDAADKWYDYLTSEDENALPPEIGIDFKGRTFTQPEDDDYITYRDEAMDDLSLVTGDSMYVSMKLMDSEITNMVYVFFFGGIIAAIAGVAIIVVSVIKRKKASSEEFY